LLSGQVMRPSIDRQHRGALTNQFELHLRPLTPFGLEDCAAELFRLQAFMSILCGRQMFYHHVRLYRHDVKDERRQRDAVTYMHRFACPSTSTKRPRSDRILFPLPLICDSLPLLWSSWTKRYKLYRSAVELFTSTEIFGGQLVNFQLLAIMQALETLHRNRFGGTYLVEKEYDDIFIVLNNSIPPATAVDLKEALRSRMKFGNEYSLRKRLRILADGLPGGAGGAVGTLIHPSLQDFLNRSVQTRNYLTHFTSVLECEAFRDADLFYATQLLRWFFVAVLLVDMGLPEGHLVDALTDANKLTEARQHFNNTAPPT